MTRRPDKDAPAPDRDGAGLPLAGGHADTPARRSRPATTPRRDTTQPDLFEIPPPPDGPRAEPTPPETTLPHTPPKAAPDIHRDAPAPSGPPPGDIEAAPAMPLARVLPAAWPALAAEPANRRDAFLYILTSSDVETIAHALATRDAFAPVLAERGACAEALRRMAEADPAGLSALSCLRVRRYLLAELEDDPDETTRLGAACYRLAAR